jgi:fibronectin type 3 domain-containing protein
MRRYRFLGLGFVVLTGLLGCGRRGPPIVPVLIEPSPPSDVQAQAQRRVVVLTWKRPGTNVDGTPLKTLAAFRISRQQRVPQPSEMSVIATVKAEMPDNAVVSENRYAFTDSSVAVAARYAYHVQSVNRRGIIGPPSPEATVEVTIDVEAPTDVRTEAGERTIRLSWSAPTRRADGRALEITPAYNLYRGTTPGRYESRPVNREPIKATQFDDGDLVNDQTYYYVVRPVEGEAPPWQEGLQSLEVSAVPVDLTPPAPPEGVRAVLGPGELVSLSWEPSREADLLGYLVYRSDGPNRRPRRLLETPSRVPSLRDRSVRTGGQYTYTVTAIDTSSRRNESAPSEEVEVVLP